MAQSSILSPGQVIEEAPAPQPQEWEQNLNNGMICPDCRINPPELDHNFQTGDFVCMNCGLVLGQRLVDNRSEWRTFSNDENGGDDPSRVGKAESALEAGGPLETNISFGDGGKGSKELHRAQNRMTDDKGKKNLNNSYNDMSALASALNIPEPTLDYAKLIFKLTHNEKSLKGKAPDALRASCIFMACRAMGHGRSFKEIQNMAKVNKKDVGRIFKLLDPHIRNNPALQTRSSTTGERVEQATSTSAEELCTRFGSNLVLSNAATNCSKQIAERLRKLGSLAGRSPLSAAAACIYMGSHLLGEGRKAGDIAQVAGVSDSTTRSAYKRIEPQKHQLIDPEWLKPRDKNDVAGQIRGGDMERLPSG